MNKLQLDIIEYLKSTYLKNIELINSDANKLTLINTCYKDIEKIYDDCDLKLKIITPLTNKQSDIIKSIYSEIEQSDIEQQYIRSLVYIRRENMLVDNVDVLSFNSLYPTTIKILLQENIIKNEPELYLDSYCYLVDNFLYFKSNLSIDDYKIFKLIINYKFGILSRGTNIPMIVSTFCNKLMSKILDSDKLNNILYIDTYQIFYNNALDLNIIYDNVDNLYRSDLEYENKYLFIVNKKRYMLFDNLDNVKIRGLEVSQRYKDKKVTDLAYKHYINTHPMIDYNEFFKPQYKEERYKLIRHVKNILLRKDKLKHISDNYDK